MSKPLEVVVLLSGYGSTLQAILDAELPITIKAIISNEPDAYGLTRGEKAGIPTYCIPHADFSTREAFDAAIQQKIDQCEPDLIVLAGFMRVLGPQLTAHYAGQMINIHPALLPKYRGLHTHQRALKAGDREHGSTVHYVTSELDGGPIIAYAICPIQPDDTVETLRNRVQTLEYKLYPEVIRWFAEGRLALNTGIVFLDQRPLPATGQAL